METVTKKQKKVKEPLEPKLKKIRWVIAGIIIFLLVLAFTLVILSHFDIIDAMPHEKEEVKTAVANVTPLLVQNLI